MKSAQVIFGLLFSLCVIKLNAQISIADTNPVVENFDGMGAGLILPADWRIHNSSTPTWASATATLSAQASSGSPATGGTYNWGSTTLERAAGCMTSGGFSSPNSLMAYFRNTNSAELTTLTISYDVERYRRNTAAASIQFFYSLNGSTWTAVPAGDVAATSLSTGASAYSFNPPDTTLNIAAFSTPSLGVTPNSDIYLRWNINTTGSNSQGLGIDNVSITATFAAVADINIQSPVGVNVACGSAIAAFGDVGVGSTGTATVRIENLGTADLNLTNLPFTITGANANQFSILTQPSTPIAAGSSSDMEIQFIPTSIGAKTATISISSNDVNESPCTITLNGTGIAQSLYFRSKNSGDWTDVNTWETSPNGSSWSNATVTPVNFASDLSVTIQSPHVVNLLDDLTVDELVVAAGATLSASSITKLNFNNGTGVDFDLQGTFEDNAGSANTATFVSGAKWQMGGAATFLKTSDSGIAIYRDNYEGGISTIPAGAQWIVRLTTNIDLAAVGMFYPNLSLECVSGAVDMGMAGSTGGFCTIKGNLEVGVNGAGTVRLNNANFNATSCQVLGNLTIGDRSEIRNTNTGGTTFGTGFDLFGNLNASGDVDLGFGTGLTKGVLGFKGNGSQDVTGDGLISVNNWLLNKTGSHVNFTALTYPPIVYENINLTNRNIVLNDEDLWLDLTCTVTNASNNSFVQTNSTGTVFRETTSTHPFPIGFSTYNPITVTGSGALDYFHARVEDVVYTDGTSGAPFTTNVVDRTWFVTEEAAGGNTMNLTATWFSSDELSGFTRGACYVSHHDGTQWNPTTSAAASGSGSGPFTRTRTGQTSFSPFAVGSNGALPVELIEFTAVGQGKTVQLAWRTATEQNNAYFEVERSLDGLQFEVLGKVAGAGNSTSIQQYQFVDGAPVAGDNFYRLRQVDFDGGEEFSPVVIASTKNNTAMYLFPVPVKDRLWVTFEEPNLQFDNWVISDALGRIVRASTLPEAQDVTEIDLSDLPKGMYLFQCKGARNQQSQLFIKE
jgi:hypothetical protein